MKYKVLVVCEEEGARKWAIEEEIKTWNEEVAEAYILRVIKCPPMQWVEHGGADTGAQEQTIEESLRRKREEWTAHEEEIHGKGIERMTELFKGLGASKVSLKFVEEEFSFAESVVSEINEGGYDSVVISNTILDRLNGKKIDPAIDVIIVPVAQQA